MALTADELRGLLDYDPDSGMFCWKVRRGQRGAIGEIAGSFSGAGYRQVKLYGTVHKAHRLAWLWMTGAWPENEVDHRDGDKGNNRWSNLRAATRAQNMQNKRVYKSSKSGLKGVWIDPRYGRWVAHIRLQGKGHYLGSFPTPEEAHAAYRAAADRLFGEFAYQP